MNAMPFYSAQGGGKFTWHCVGYDSGFDYSDQLVSVQGLCRSVGFNGEIKVPEITITIAGYGLSNDGVGNALIISLTENNTNNSVDFGYYIIKNIETTGTIVTIKATGRCGEVIPQDYNVYSVPANNPRDWVANWLQWASNGRVTPAALVYNDNYQRSLTRVAAPAATLKVAGFVQENLSTHARGDNKTDYPTTSWSSVYSLPCIVDIQRDLAPDWENMRNCLGQQPLFWHQRNQTWQITITARSTNPAVTTAKCQFPCGYFENIFYTMVLQNGAINNPTIYFSPERQTTPGDTQKIEVKFKTMKETVEYYKKIDRASVPTETGLGAAQNGVEVKFSLAQKKVIINNIGKFQGTLMPWYNQAKSVIASSAPIPTAPINDSILLENVTIANDVVGQDYSHYQGYSINNITFKGVRYDSMWTSIGINSYNNLKSVYQLQQWGIRPITIDQRYFTRDYMEQAATLGSVGIFEGNSGGTYGPEFCDVCPENGDVYELPLTVSTVAEVAMGTAYPMPGTISCTFMDVKGEDHTYTYSYGGGQTEQSASFAIVQGHTQGWQQPASNQIGISSEKWDQAPGGLGDRWTGSYMSSNHVYFTALSDGQPAFSLLTDGGTLISATTIGNVSSGTQRAVRDFYGNQYSLFLTTGVVNVTGAPAGQKNVNPYLDFYPILQWLQANQRVFSDNLTRQAFSIKTTLAFASATPGDVVAIQLDKIFNGAKALGLIIGVEVSTDGYCNLEIVPMHKITTDDYTNFTNLGEILP